MATDGISKQSEVPAQEPVDDEAEEIVDGPDNPQPVPRLHGCPACPQPQASSSTRRRRGESPRLRPSRQATLSARSAGETQDPLPDRHQATAAGRPRARRQDGPAIASPGAATAQTKIASS
jgi:hypothetical protein